MRLPLPQKRIASVTRFAAPCALVLVLAACDDKPAASHRITPADESRSAGAKGADPTPKAGALVLGSQSLENTRAEIAKLTASDVVTVTVLSYGRDSDGNVSLNFTVKNGGACTLTALAGVAYGFDARGRASAVNAGGETYVAFTVDKQQIAKGESGQLSVPVHNVPLASIGVAHVDTTTCDDGKIWTRP